jgi:hypothetical protein
VTVWSYSRPFKLSWLILGTRQPKLTWSEHLPTSKYGRGGSRYHGGRKARSTREQSETARRAPTGARHRAASSARINTTSPGKFCTVTVSTPVSPHANRHACQHPHWTCKNLLNNGYSFYLMQSREGKSLYLHILKAYWWSRGIPPVIHNVGTGWMYAFSLTFRLLYPQYPLNSRLPQRQSGSSGKEKKFARHGSRTTGRPPYRPVHSTYYALPDNMWYTTED